MAAGLRTIICGAALLSLGTSGALAESGIASVYGYNGSKTASGERANPGGLTAAHKTLPFGTQVRVTNKRNGKSVVIRINDRGPFIRGRVIDLTPAGARALGFSGLAPVTLARASGVAAGSGESSFASATPVKPEERAKSEERAKPEERRKSASGAKKPASVFAALSRFFSGK